MKVTVLFFGATADEAGTGKAEIELPPDAAAEYAFGKVLDEYPALTASRRRQDLLFSINQEYASGGEKIGEGDELAVFTAVSGG